MARPWEARADVFHLRLEAIDRAWRAVLAIHTDISHCNEASKENREAMEGLSEAFRDMWMFKSVWANQKD